MKPSDQTESQVYPWVLAYIVLIIFLTVALNTLNASIYTSPTLGLR